MCICNYYSLFISYNKKIMKKWFFIVTPGGLKNFSDKSPKGEIPVFLACPDVDPTHSPKIGYSLCSQ